MSLSYDDADTGLFTHIGKLIKHYDQFYADATLPTTGLDADRKEILDALQAGDQDLAADGLVSAYESWKAEYIQRRSELAGLILARLRQLAVLREIGAVSSDSNEILSKLVNRMRRDSETISESSVALGSVTAVGGNTGNGTVLSTKLLDAVNSPGTVHGVQMPAHPAYRGLNSELCVPTETWQFRVTADSFSDAVEEGAEEFAWEGNPADQLHGLEAEGSGAIATITPLHASELLLNADFENFTSNAPDDWTIDGGAAGTNLFAESTGAKVYHGGQSLKFTGSGVATIQISQSLDGESIQGGRAYCVSARVIADASVSNGTLTIQLLVMIVERVS